MRREDGMPQSSVRLPGALAAAPFAERGELAAFTCLPLSSSLESLLGLEARGLASFVRHTRSNTSRVRRWHLTPSGIMLLAEIQSTSTAKLLQKLLLSAEWCRRLPRRLDAVAPLYRVSRDVAVLSNGPIKWRWLRSGALDALVELPDGRTLALARLGPTLSWQSMRNRIGTLYGMQRAGRCPAALLLLPGNLEAQRLAADLRGRAIDVHSAAESDVMRTAPGSAVWRRLRDTRDLTLAQVVGKPSDMRRVHVQMGEGSGREIMPTDTPGPGADGLDLLATELTMPGRRLLDAIYDWPLTSAAHLGMLLDMTEAMMKKTRAHLVRRGLVCQVRIGATPELRRRNGTRLCLSADGLRYIAHRDRRRVSDLLGRWSITPDEGGDVRLSIPDYRLEGSKLCVLARELRHTDGVSVFVGAVAAACREGAEWRLRQALPPHRWERWFRYDTGWRSVRPDATFELAHRGRRLSFLLEYEERVRNPAPMTAKLLRYRRYFGAADTTADFDGRRAPRCSCSLTRPRRAASARSRRERRVALFPCLYPAQRCWRKEVRSGACGGRHGGLSAGTCRLPRHPESGVNGRVLGASESVTRGDCIGHVPPRWHIEPVREILTWHMMRQILLHREASG